MPAAMAPPAPARFSTTMLWPRYSASLLCMTRATVSVPPPGAKPTTMVTGRVGYVCADAFGAAARAVNAIAMVTAFLIPPPSNVSRFLRPVLFSLEYGLALLHERAPAFDVVLAVEALPDQRRARLCVERGIGLEQLADDSLACAD